MSQPSLIDRLRAFIDGPAGWQKLGGPAGLFIQHWRTRDDDGQLNWEDVYREVRRSQFLDKLEKSYLVYGLDSVHQRLADNVRALTAIRLDRLDEARRFAGARAVLWHALWHNQPPLRRNEIAIPVVAATGGRDGEVLELTLQFIDLEHSGVFETPEMALLPATPTFLETLSQAAPKDGAHVWSLGVWHAEGLPPLVDGDSCGGAAECGFALLHEEGRYDPGAVVLATREFGRVGGLDAKISAVFNATDRTNRRFQRIIVSSTAAIGDAQRAECEKRGIQITPVAGRVEAIDAVRGKTIPSSAGIDRTSPPYVGPEPFSEKHELIFFGRKKEIRELVELLRNQQTRLVLLYAASGAGKSSLLNAGVRPVLAMRGFEVLPTARLNDVRTAPAGHNPYTHAALLSALEEGDDAEPAVDWVTHLARHPTRSRRLLILDQLEEIETGPLIDVREKDEFFNQLREALNDERSLTILLCFREEYLASISRYFKNEAHVDPESSSDQENPLRPRTFELSRLTWEKAKEAIEGPARTRGVQFTDDALADLRTALVDRNTGRFEPILLQLLCTRMWERLPHGTKLIDVQDIALTLGLKAGANNPAEKLLERILVDFCRESIKEAAAANGFPGELIRLGLLQFLSPSSRRAAIQEGLVGNPHFTGDLPTVVVQVLERKHLLRSDRRNDGRLYELAHDRLIETVKELARVPDGDLVALFDRTVSAEAAKLGGAAATLAQECILALVSDEGARQSVPRNGPVAPLRRFTPEVRQALLRAGLLRPSREDPDHSLELTHGALAMALLPRRAEALTPYYHVRGAIAERLKGAVRRHGAHLADYFVVANDFVDDVLDQVGLADLDAAESLLVLRCSLASGHRLAEIVPYFQTHHFTAAGRTLSAAARFSGTEDASFTVRVSAARALADIAAPGRKELLIELALDPVHAVRREAAHTLGLLDDPAAWSALEQVMAEDGQHDRALTVAAWVRDATYTTRRAPKFEAWWDRLPRALKLSAQWRLLWARVQHTFPRLTLTAIFAMLSAIAFVAPMRAVIGYWGWTVTQLTSEGLTGLSESGFVGTVGAAILGLEIGSALLIWWFIVEGRAPWRRSCPSLRSGIVGGTAGFLGGISLSLVLVFVYGRDSLRRMGWIREQDVLPEIFLGTGMGLVLPFAGMLVGLGVGAMTLRFLPKWDRKLSREDVSRPRSPLSLVPLYGRACRHCAIGMVMQLPLMLFGAALFRLFLTTQVIMPHNPGIEARLVGDYLDIGIGGLGLMAGLLIALVVMSLDFELGGIKVSRLPGYSLRQLYEGDDVERPAK